MWYVNAVSALCSLLSLSLSLYLSAMLVYEEIDVQTTVMQQKTTKLQFSDHLPINAFSISISLSLYSLAAW